MKRVIYFFMVGLMVVNTSLFAQKNDDRMKRDIAVMETALSEMIKQELDQRNFFFSEVKGNYVAGYGVTFTVPTNMLSSVTVLGSQNDMLVIDGTVTGFGQPRWAQQQLQEAQEELAIAEREMATQEAMKKKDQPKTPSKAKEPGKKKSDNSDEGITVVGELSSVRVRPGVQVYSPSGTRKRINNDSMAVVNNDKIISAAKNFMADYGDMLSQLSTEERIVVTNRGNTQNQFNYFGQNNKSSLMSVELRKSDLIDFRQGKLNREQLIAKMKVVNSVTSNKVEPDMELLVSIFNRLYREDLSRTYYTQGSTYYERLTDFGAILHMQVVSSIVNEYNVPAKEARLVMPTLGLANLTQEERDKKVKELYPMFESELKENILDYGRTLKSLNDNEQLIVNVTLTKCQDCGIPATLELAVKASVLKDYNAGKLEKSAALSKIEVKKGAAQ